MAKNHMLNSCKPLLEKMVCKIYAVFCIALVEEYGWSAEQAEEICELSQALWQASLDKDIDIFKWCKDVTGLDMQARVHEKEKK